VLIARSATRDDPRLLARREMLVGGVLAAAALIGFVREPRIRQWAVHDGPLDPLIPQAVETWHVAPGPNIIQPPADERRLTSTYDQVMLRNYWSPIYPGLMLLIAYSGSQSGTLQIHRPETCYPAAGFSVVSHPNVFINNERQRFEAQTMTATSDERTEQILFWTRIGDHFPQTWHQQCASVRYDNLRGFIPDGVLVRLSVISGDVEASTKILQRFAERLVANAEGRGRQLLVGPVTASIR
jgi:EpsI family protein